MACPCVWIDSIIWLFPERFVREPFLFITWNSFVLDFINSDFFRKSGSLVFNRVCLYTNPDIEPT